MSSTVSFYDLDGTITRGPTWLAFLLFAAARRRRWRLVLLPAVLAAMMLHVAGAFSRDRLKEIMHLLLLGRAIDGAELDLLARRFAERLVPSYVRGGAVESIRADRSMGYRVVVATAAHRFYAAAIARSIGVEDLIATDCTVLPGGAVGWRLQGVNLYGRAKLAAVEGWLSDNRLARDDVRLRFYSDHVSDAPCLAFVDEPFAVHPHAPLISLAEARGWPTLDWNIPDEGRRCTRSS